MTTTSGVFLGPPEPEREDPGPRRVVVRRRPLPSGRLSGRDARRLVRAGRRAAAAGEPVLNSSFPEPGPVVLGIARRLGADLELLCQVTLQSVVPLLVQRHQNVERAANARTQLADLTAALADGDDPTDPTARRTGEEHLDALTVAERRRRERQVAREPERAEVAAATRIVEHQLLEIVRLTTEIEGTVRLTLSRAAERREQALAAVSVYVAAVVHHHPHGQTLAELGWPAFPESAGWTRDFAAAMQAFCGGVFDASS